MSNQSENEQQQSMTPEEARQHLLAELDASKQAIAELSNEELEKITGGAGILSRIVTTQVSYGLVEEPKNV